MKECYETKRYSKDWCIYVILGIQRVTDTEGWMVMDGTWMARARVSIMYYQLSVINYQLSPSCDKSRSDEIRHVRSALCASPVAINERLSYCFVLFCFVG